MDNFISNPNPWILTICGGIVSGLILLIIQRHLQLKGKRRSNEKINSDGPKRLVATQTKLPQSQTTPKKEGTALDPTWIIGVIGVVAFYALLIYLGFTGRVVGAIAIFIGFFLVLGFLYVIAYIFDK